MKNLKIILCFLIFFPMVSLASQTLLPNEQNTITVFKKASPFVVNVHRYKAMATIYNDVFDVPAGTGTGFIWDKQGHVVTNYHVVRDSAKFSVTLQNGKVVPAKVVGIAPRKDIALLQLESVKDIPAIGDSYPLPLADPSTLQVGQKTIAIGNPFGLDHTVTTGIISALGRRIPGIGGVMIHDMIQTDASINPGNSGGPLINSSGELIGMNTMIYSNSGASAGIGFAVPSNTIKRVVDQLMRYGHEQQPALGIQVLPDVISSQFGLQGVIIADVLSNSPAEKAGLKGSTRDMYGNIHLGDVIISIDGKRIKSFDDLYVALESKKIGDTAQLEVLRDKKVIKINVKLAEFSESE